MSYDGIVTKAIVSELNKTIINGKINKVFEPNKNEVLLGVYSNGVNYILDLVINPNCLRVNLSTHTKQNPFNAYGFCMLLRKHLIGSKVVKINTVGLERIIFIELECYNELNDLIHKKLIIELMGKHSNIILVNQNNRIIDSLRHLDIDSNSCRNILPAYEYEMPPCEKLDFLNLQSNNEFYEALKSSKENNLQNAICLKFNGISKFFMQKAIQNLQIDNFITRANTDKIYSYLSTILDNLGSQNINCTPFKNDYVLSLENSENALPINNFIDEFYYSKENDLIFSEYRKNLSKLVLLTLKKVNKKLININKKLKECENMDTYKLYGELLTANLYNLGKDNIETVSIHNYYDNNNLLTIPLDKRFSPSDNAKNYFKKYRKLKNALEIVGTQKIEAKQELDYIESIIYELDTAKNISDINEIYNEISESSLFEIVKKKAKQKISKNISTKKYINVGTPISTVIDHFQVYIGKNNKQNDYLTTKFARKNDLWFHTKDIHGSHVILKIEKEFPSMKTIEKCAQIAAFYSKAQNSSNVPVDYTFVKYVKKPHSAKPGMVIYTHQKTLYVNPNNHY